MEANIGAQREGASSKSVPYLGAASPRPAGLSLNEEHVGFLQVAPADVSVMNDDQIPAAARLLWDLWVSDQRIARLPDEIRPVNASEAFAIQDIFASFSAVPPIGWKIAATSRAGQAHIGVSGPLSGRLLKEMLLEDGAHCHIGQNVMRSAEPEFAFRMSTDLPAADGPFSCDDVRAAIASIHPAIEIPDSRFGDYRGIGEAQLIADNACAHRFVLGAAGPDDWRSFDLAQLHVELTIVDGSASRGTGANVLGHPVHALTWLANALRERGEGLKAGDIVMTGASAPPLAISPGNSLVADFGLLGKVQLHIA